MLTRSEEDHIKAVHGLLQSSPNASTTDIAERLGTKASSVTVMLKKLAEKGLIKHRPYHGVQLTAKGKVAAWKLVRKHRLWETFLVARLGFRWDEVHEVAEQLEHVSSDKLTNGLDDYLGNPAFDPHGDPIPDRNGRVQQRDIKPLTDCTPGERVRIARVSHPSDSLLHLLDQKGIGIGMVFTVEMRQAFDGSVEMRGKPGSLSTLSAQVAGQLLVETVGS
ncbi:MAG: metal-dependent transcriptional regulator [Flavobacteriales bacterium]